MRHLKLCVQVAYRRRRRAVNLPRCCSIVVILNAMRVLVLESEDESSSLSLSSYLVMLNTGNSVIIF